MNQRCLGNSVWWGNGPQHKTSKHSLARSGFCFSKAAFTQVASFYFPLTVFFNNQISSFANNWAKVQNWAACVNAAQDNTRQQKEKTYKTMVLSKQMSVSVRSTITMSVSWISPPTWSRQNAAHRCSSEEERESTCVSVCMSVVCACAWVCVHECVSMPSWALLSSYCT